MANNRRITDLPKEIFTTAMPQANVTDKEVTAVIGMLSNTGNYFHRMFKEELTKRAMRTLYQAVIDDDRETVKRILVARPNLLLVEPPTGLVIESKLTWQKFYAEKPAIMAAKRKQIKMLELIDELEQTELVKQAKAEALLAWSPYKTQQNAQGEDEIVISRLYADYAKSLIDVFMEEAFPNGTKGKFSEKTENALKLLFDILLPKKAVKLDDYIDPELFLLALYTVYRDHFDSFQNWDQRDAFCVRMIGLAQSVLSPETAKIFCEGLYYVVEEKRAISARAVALKLLDDELFYRLSRDSRSGLGFEYLWGARSRAWLARGGRAFGKTMSSKKKNFLEH